MALEGTLRDFSFADILQLISLQRKTGVLTLKNEQNVVTISFLDGCIVGSSSLNQHPEDRIGLILLKKGELTAPELDAALRKQEETLQRLGRILIDHHVVQAESVREALQQQILQIIYRVFKWDDGDYHFSQETDVDYDRDLMHPMAADSIIMEGARMTDEWPFIDSKLPDRDVVFTRSNPDQTFEVVDDEDDDLDSLNFSFSDSPEEEITKVDQPGEKLTATQLAVYNLVNGRDSINEIVLESPIIEFDTCKALTELADKGLIREATQEEVAQNLREEIEDEEAEERFGLTVPLLAVPFLVLLGFSLTIMAHNPLNPSFGAVKSLQSSRFVEGATWFWMNRISVTAETSYFLDGLYPEDVSELVETGVVQRAKYIDALGRQFRLVSRGGKLMVTATRGTGSTSATLILSRSLAWEGGLANANLDSPGVVFIGD